MKTKKRKELKPEELRVKIDPNSLLEVEATGGFPDLINQEEGVEALKDLARIRSHHHNGYVSGADDIGKMNIIRTVLEKEPPLGKLCDWIYVFNFDEDGKSNGSSSKVLHPAAIDLPAGKAVEFKREIEDIIQILREKVPGLSVSAQLDLLIKRAEEGEVRIIINPQMRQIGATHLSFDESNNTMSKEEFDSLTEEQQQSVREKEKYWMQEVVNYFQTASPEQEKESIAKKIADYVKLLFAGCPNYNLPKVAGWLDEVKKDILINIDEFKNHQAEGNGQQNPFMAMMPAANKDEFFKRYEVNMIVSNRPNKVPIVVEFRPEFVNIFGCHLESGMGGMFSADHTTIKPGAIYKANGGYLLLRLPDMANPNFFGAVWPMLKKVIKNKEISPEDFRVTMSQGNKILEAEAIPWTGKIILVGDEEWYYLLSENDGDFKSYFKIKVELRSRTDKEGAEKQLARQIAAFAKKYGKTITNDGIARVVEYSHELAGHQKMISLETAKIRDLVKEASDFCGANEISINKEKIEYALKRKELRSNMYREAILRAHKEGIFLVETEGKKPYQGNGLYVSFHGGDNEFGGVSRITAVSSCGKEGVVSIDRQVKLTGKSFNKAIEIIDLCLRKYFAQEKSLTLSAGIVFEQMYSGIDGDSATLIEFCVLLSALSDLPINQGIATTGSMDALGNAQPIGGVNHKIRGFYDLCKLHGLTGNQGVVIPKRNIQHLMVDSEVVNAVDEGKFHIYPVDTVEETAEILMGLPFEEIAKKVAEKLEKFRKAGNGGEIAKKSESEHSCDSCGKCK